VRPIGTINSIGEVGGTRVEALVGDLVSLPFDAIVCPANVFLEMRGGVSATIRERAGRSGGRTVDQVERDAIALGPIRIGDAVLTRGYDLPSSYVIHAPTVEMPVDRASRRTVALAMGAALKVAHRHSFRTLGVPSMGTGTGGISYQDAARVMLSETYRYLGTVRSNIVSVTFVAWEQEFLDALRAVPAPPVDIGATSRRPVATVARVGLWSGT
jgi:O-acetyl-ADP-ribose deacetylase (regulator of RNase III)